MTNLKEKIARMIQSNSYNAIDLYNIWEEKNMSRDDDFL